MIRDFVRRRKVRREYERLDCALIDTVRDLYTTSDPTARAGLLRQMADLEQGKARLHGAAWGPDPVPGDGRDYADTLALSADLLTTLAATEQDIVVVSAADVSYAEASLWRDLADARDHDRRAELIADIAVYAIDRAGVLAVQSFLEAGRSEREFAAAEREGRAPRAPRTGLKTSIAAAVFLAAIVAVEVVIYLLPHFT